ncbi:MAG: tetratricopeptide repeat protein [Candidatus Kariarchaeaceae archaeon]
MDLPHELAPFLLELEDLDLSFLEKLISDCPSDNTVETWSRCLISAYQSGVDLSSGLTHMLAKLVYFSTDYDLLTELSENSSSIGAQLWSLEEKTQHMDPSEVLEILLSFQNNSLSLLEQAELFNRLSKTYVSLGDYLASIQVVDDAISFLHTLKGRDFDLFNQAIIPSFFIKSWTKLHLGDIKGASSIAEEGLFFAEKYNDRFYTGLMLNALSIVRIHQGAYDHAHKLTSRGYTDLNELDLRTATTCLTNKGLAYLYQGKYQKALDTYSLVLDYWETKNQRRNIITIHTYQGRAYKGLGKIDQAVKEAKLALSLLEATNIKEAWFYCEASDVFLFSEELQECENALLKAKELTKLSTSNYDKLYISLLSGGLELKKMNYGVANDHLNVSLDLAVEHNYKDLTLKSLFFLSELAIRKFESTLIEHYLIEAEERINDIKFILKQSHLPFAAINLLIVQSSFEKALLKFDNAFKLLETAIQLADENQFFDLKDQAKKQKDELNDMIGTGEPLSSGDLLPKLRALEDVSLSITSRQFSKDQASPLILLIINPDGIPFFTHVFDEEMNEVFNKQMVISGILRALSDVSGEIFSTTGRSSLKSIQYKDYSILLEVKKGDLLFAMITDYETFEIRHKLRNLVHHINEELFPTSVPTKNKKRQSAILEEVYKLLGF